MTPFNPANRVVPDEFVAATLRRYGVPDPPRDLDWYRRAFVHRSYCTRKNDNVVTGNADCPHACLPLQDVSYERLEFLGDSVLNNVVASYLFDRYPDEQEGFLTSVRSMLVNGKTLAVLGERLGLAPYVMLSRQVEANGGRAAKAVLEDVFEAFVGAIFCDFSRGGCPAYRDDKREGYGHAYRFLVGVLETHVDLSALLREHAAAPDAKSTLLRHYQHATQSLPRFVCEAGDARDPCVVRILDRDGRTMAVGRGATRRAAETDAATQALLGGWHPPLVTNPT